ncbi:MAG: type II toxin-antitoxin system HipA family toxin [Granulosicoccus sp.]|nr:type II toxin-antitoxin system HipA family toxin [Granulosicoccus sp.]
MTTASVELWGRRIGAVSWQADRGLGVFQYVPDFETSGIELSPVQMPWRRAPYEFPSLPRKTFKGLPGMLADSLPDKFGNALIDVWLAQQGRDPNSFNPVERLCYTGTRGMGALEFQPAIIGTATAARKIEVTRLVALSNRILDERNQLRGQFDGDDDAQDIEDILRVGTSAGGARAKAILAWNESTGEFRSGQVAADKGFSHWLMKFDGVDKNSDKELADPKGFGRIEYAYYLMACDARITMMPCRLFEEGGRAHFMTRRFDRTDAGAKLHYQSLGALMHSDFESAGAHSYEQALLAVRQLRLPPGDREQQVRRAFFNIAARNQDDHVKNIGFVMDKDGDWRLSPAFDVAYSYNPTGDWTAQHQMSLNGKRDNFEPEDLIAFAKLAGMKKAKAQSLLEEIGEVVRRWRDYAGEAQVEPDHQRRIANSLRLESLGLA